LLNLIPQHTLDFVAHSFGAGGAEMYAHLVGGLADFLHKGRALVLRRGDGGGAAGVGCGGSSGNVGLFVTHRRSFRCRPRWCCGPCVGWLLVEKPGGLGLVGRRVVLAVVLAAKADRGTAFQNAVIDSGVC